MLVHPVNAGILLYRPVQKEQRSSVWMFALKLHTENLICSISEPTD